MRSVPLVLIILLPHLGCGGVGSPIFWCDFPRFCVVPSPFFVVWRCSGRGLAAGELSEPRRFLLAFRISISFSSPYLGKGKGIWGLRVPPTVTARRSRPPRCAGAAAMPPSQQEDPLSSPRGFNAQICFFLIKKREQTAPWGRSEPKSFLIPARRCRADGIWVLMSTKLQQEHSLPPKGYLDAALRTTLIFGLDLKEIL